MINSATLNNALLNTFSEPALFDTTGGEVLQVNGIFDRIITPNTIGLINHGDASFTLTVREADIDAYNIEDCNSVTVLGYKYQILAIDIG